ncbi:sensor histidine kinase [Teichococcus aestuarii]|uniref:sensor histidine kinase n=1 Tax=Teichococcus aestuarii TaxID=568898 RepID=UPI00361C3367
MRVAARRAGPELVLSVEDAGSGIPADQLGQVFDPFFRIRRGDSAPAGTGLGLAICRGLVHAMGGRITAQSPAREAPGENPGTRMSVHLPL